MEEKVAKLVAFYANKSTRIGFLSGVKSGYKVIPAKTWTIVEDITDTSDILNFNSLGKIGVSVYSGSFRTKPPFDGSPKPTNFAVIKEDTDTVLIANSYSEYLSSSKNATAEIKNALRVSSFDSSKADFSTVNFSTVDFSKVNFSGATVYKIDFSNLDVSQLDFTKLDVSKVSIKSDLKKVDFSKVIWKSGSPEVLASRWNSVDITLLDSKLYSFENVNFSNSNFSKVVFSGLSFSKLNIQSYNTARVSDVKIIFKNGNFEKVNFTGIDFSEVNFLDSIFGDKVAPIYGVTYMVDLSGVNFEKLNFTKVNFSNLNFIGA